MANPTWRFPSRNGGIDYVNDPSSTHFSDAPVAKLVRELIQNSLDAKLDGFDGPVTVTFSETTVKRELIGGVVLQRHLQSCLERATADDRPDMVDTYTNALSVIRRRDIPCLRVQDTGTMGLNDARWKALVMQEGAVSKGGGAPGGSYGIGKNAILNVSDLQTVFYSTRLVEGRRGLVTKFQGKATLTGHSDPNGSDDDLQHIGFYNRQGAGPIMGKDIPEFFQLVATGTGVFIMGFNPHSSDWVAQVATAVIENFFYAIHRQTLIVRVVPDEGRPVKIDHQTIDYLFSRLKPINRNAVHYYRAIRDLPEEDVEVTRRFRKLGSLRAYIVFAEGSPRRIAHINRNGMLITDSREQKVNPLAPRGRSLWPDYVGVIVPDSDAGDLWLRRMENPSHDSLSSGQLRSEEDRREADRRMKTARRVLRDIIDHKAEIGSYGEASNIDELAGILPDQDDTDGDRVLKTQVIETRITSSNVVEVAGDANDEGGGEGDDRGAGSGGGRNGTAEGRGAGADGSRPVRRRDTRVLLRRVRYIPLSSREAIVAFNPISDPPREVRLSLMPAGTDLDLRRARPVAITEAATIGEHEEPLPVSGGTIVFTPDSDDRMTVRVTADGNLDRQAFRLR
ncbi:MAG: hypothetical protein OXI84_03915 [bacterium]|nr:hypothetical protein [bacterium]